ncbi:MAG: hypothetical protein IKK43_01870 [Clostridia bacterium]|nr:hypothetical protein [Clostridia bacterium]
MEKQKEKNSKIHSFFKFIFKLSFLYYIFWLIVSIKYSITGISSEYVGIHIESLCNHIHTTYYGFEGFCAGIENCIIYTLFVYWFIPLYQVVYIIINIVNSIIKKVKNAK